MRCRRHDESAIRAEQIKRKREIDERMSIAPTKAISTIASETARRVRNRLTTALPAAAEQKSE